MTAPALKVGDRVRDTWWPNNPGRVVKVRKTRIVVKFDDDYESPANHSGNPLVYDFQHANAFLRRANPQVKR